MADTRAWNPKRQMQTRASLLHKVPDSHKWAVDLERRMKVAVHQ